MQISKCQVHNVMQNYISRISQNNIPKNKILNQKTLISAISLRGKEDYHATIDKVVNDIISKITCLGSQNNEQCSFQNKSKQQSPTKFIFNVINDKNDKITLEFSDFQPSTFLSKGKNEQYIKEAL